MIGFALILIVVWRCMSLSTVGATGAAAGEAGAGAAQDPDDERRSFWSGGPASHSQGDFW